VIPMPRIEKKTGRLKIRKPVHRFHPAQGISIMTIERIILAFAGTAILLSLGLAYSVSPY